MPGVFTRLAFVKAKRAITVLSAVFLALHLNVAYPQGVGQGLESNPLLFGYKESEHANLTMFPQWISVLKRQAKDDLKDKDCESPSFNSCHLRNWQRFLSGLKGKPLMEQISAVNAYGNQKKYVLDEDNYGASDYWATPREFLYNNGDCEDFAIFKYLSLKQLGFSPDSMRILVLQDTNLRIGHAVLAVFISGDALILDNQVQELISHKKIAHYVPIFSVNEKHWWMHMP